jgi:hypothetical protein
MVIYMAENKQSPCWRGANPVTQSLSRITVILRSDDYERWMICVDGISAHQTYFVHPLLMKRSLRKLIKHYE